MRRSSLAVTGLCVGSLAFVFPVVTHAKTVDVDMGTPVANQKAFQDRYGVDVNDYFPHRATIRVGDSVRFRPTGFHTVELPRAGQKPLPLLSPTGQKVAGATDATGASLWFNGQDQMGFTKSLLASAFGKRRSYSGAADVNSGLPLEDKPKPFTVRFTRTGSFDYYCNIHDGMEGNIRVVGRNRPAPSAAALARVKKAEVARDLRVAKVLAKRPVPTNTVNVGVPAKNGVELFAFVPQRLTVVPGTTVRFQMPADSFEVHTATTGPGDPEHQPTSFLGQLASAYTKPVFEPSAGVYPSDPPGTLVGLTPTTRGNGFWNSGVMDAASSTPNVPNATAVRFDAPGTYEFYCLVHPFMHGTVAVQ
jgi:plastocyanin